ncbi:MAG: hypothetical protein KIG50_07330 [Lachnospiraceae bacterium]|nr:hypothetical protein [Lachnospiraceae bacterium]
MSIYGIGQYGNFQSQYRIADIPKVDVEQKSASPVKEEQDALINSSSLSIVEGQQADERRFTDPNEISIGINKNDDFSYIGKDKDIQNLDIRKAISDMQKDSILQDYQYFVGNAREIYHSEDGIVLSKQPF